MKFTGISGEAPSYWCAGKMQDRKPSHLIPGTISRARIRARGGMVETKRAAVFAPQLTTELVTNVDGDAVDVSVLIPCLNEANSIGICVEKAQKALQEAGLSGEVVVADNGSTDGSIEIVQKLGARVIPVPQRGYGSALKAGIRAAHGAFIIMGDADDSYDFAEVPRFVAEWRKGSEVVMGNRFAGEIKPGAMPWHHKYIGNPGLTALLNLFFHSGIGDTHCGMRGFTREVFERMDLRSSGMEFASELVIKAAQIGAKTSEIPITLWKDKRGRPPHLKSFRDGWRHMRFMLLYAPNWLFLLPGGLLMAAGLFLTCWLLPGPRNIWRNVVLDVHTMIFGVIFTLMGAQILAIGSFAKVFSYAERFDRHAVAQTGDFRIWTAAWRHPFPCWFLRLCLRNVAVGCERIWATAAGPRSVVL